MKKIPETTFSQLNTSNKFGTIAASKNVNFDEEGYVKLSPRAVKIIDENTNSNLGVALAIGKYGTGSFQVATSSNANFVLGITDLAFTATEDSGTSNPTLTNDSHAVFWQDRWHASTATAVLSKDANGAASSTWTSRVTGLTSGAKHIMEVFASRNQLCVANGNVVQQYDTSYSGTVDLTIPSDFEVVGLAYNNGKMGVLTQTGLTGTSQVSEAKFYVWDGSTTAATGYGIEAPRGIAVKPYKSSFVILTSAGQLKYFNGGGFQDLAQLPFYNSGHLWTTFTSTGDPMAVDGDKVLINVGMALDRFNQQEEEQRADTPSGVWCYDPKVGLYHRYSFSNSQVYHVTVAASGADTSTDIITLNSITLPSGGAGTIPATGNVCRIVRGDLSYEIGGLTKNKDYYIIKLSTTTFALAESKELALAGVKLDITSTNTGNIYMHMYDLVDFAGTFSEYQGAIAPFGSSTAYYTNVLFGADARDLTNVVGSNHALCMTVPFLENRGWIQTARIYAPGILASWRRFTVMYKPLKTTDSIVVKTKKKDVPGLPVSAPNISSTNQATWNSPNSFSTGTDLSAAKTYLDAGGELDIEFVSGAGAGVITQVSSISEPSGGATAVTVTEDVLGATAGREAYFTIDTWETLGTITSEDSAGFKQFPVDGISKFVEYKIEMRGSDVILEYFGPDPISAKND